MMASCSSTFCEFPRIKTPVLTSEWVLRPILIDIPVSRCNLDHKTVKSDANRFEYYALAVELWYANWSRMKRTSASQEVPSSEL